MTSSVLRALRVHRAERCLSLFYSYLPFFFLSLGGIGVAR